MANGFKINFLELVLSRFPRRFFWFVRFKTGVFGVQWLAWPIQVQGLSAYLIKMLSQPMDLVLFLWLHSKVSNWAKWCQIKETFRNFNLESALFSVQYGGHKPAWQFQYGLFWATMAIRYPELDRNSVAIHVTVSFFYTVMIIVVMVYLEILKLKSDSSCWKHDRSFMYTRYDVDNIPGSSRCTTCGTKSLDLFPNIFPLTCQLVCMIHHEG